MRGVTIPYFEAFGKISRSFTISKANLFDFLNAEHYFSPVNTSKYDVQTPISLDFFKLDTLQ